MAVPKLLFNICFASVSVCGKAFVDAWRQAAVKAAQNSVASRMMSAQEAHKVLGLRPQADMKEVLQRFERLFKANDPANGGSFYLQSKVFRAREAMESELARATKNQGT